MLVLGLVSKGPKGYASSYQHLILLGAATTNTSGS